MVEPGPARRGRFPGDPTRMRNQAALHTPKRWIWLGPGLLLAVAAMVAFAMSLRINLAIAWIGIAFAVASAIGLVVAAVTVQDDRTRNLAMAGLMAVLAAMSLLLLIAILWVAQLPGL
ncbi:hypothetical protein [Microbacterium rhizophilus]|uniref:hypothetical protein n=1 Tax=Microbacterium rhizophilus TaxID=3138934 RepID=UPI0031F042B5